MLPLLFSYLNNLDFILITISLKNSHIVCFYDMARPHKGAFWNSRGKQFHELEAKYDLLYNIYNTKIIWPKF